MGFRPLGDCRDRSGILSNENVRCGVRLQLPAKGTVSDVNINILHIVYLFGCRSRTHHYYWLDSELLCLCEYCSYYPLFRSKALSLTAWVEVSYLRAKLPEKADIVSKQVCFTFHLSPFERWEKVIENLVFDRVSLRSLPTIIVSVRVGTHL
jgi:hypothetical protein